MKRTIDIDVILAPLPGDNPAGENLRYTPVYDEIKEARRADDPLDRGDWDREIKTSDWDRVIALSVEALTEKTKDLQIAAWLSEALTRTEGFEGLIVGLKILAGFLSNFWDTVYPEIDEDDRLKRGRMTDWMDLGQGFYQGVGQHVFQVGEKEIGILEIEEAVFKPNQSE